MDTRDEIPVEDHRYFSARLNHLESRNPVALLSYLEAGTLTEHLRSVTARAMRARAEMVFNQKVPVEMADELLMNQIVADPMESSRLSEPRSRRKLWSLLSRYRSSLANLPRTYLSQSETIE